MARMNGLADYGIQNINLMVLEHPAGATLLLGEPTANEVSDGASSRGLRYLQSHIFPPRFNFELHSTTEEVWYWPLIDIRKHVVEKSPPSLSAGLLASP